MIQEKSPSRVCAPMREGPVRGAPCPVRRAGRRRGSGWTAGKTSRGIQPAVPEPGRPQRQEAGTTRPRAGPRCGFRLSSRGRDSA